MVLIFDTSSFEFLFAPLAFWREALFSAPSPIATLPQTRNSGLGTPRSSAFSPSGGAPNIAQYRPVSPSPVPQTALSESQRSAEYRPGSPNIGFSVYGASTCAELADTPARQCTTNDKPPTTNNGQSPHAGTHASPLPSHLRTFTPSDRMASEPVWITLDHPAPRAMPTPRELGGATLDHL